MYSEGKCSASICFSRSGLNVDSSTHIAMLTNIFVFSNWSTSQETWINGVGPEFGGVSIFVWSSRSWHARHTSSLFQEVRDSVSCAAFPRAVVGA